jgi:hypothetical protein
VPWTLPLFDQQVIELIQYLRTACLVVVAAVSGMRSGEIMELRRGCRSLTRTPAGLTRYKLASKLVKGQPFGGINDEWVVVEAVHRAVELAEQAAPGWLDHGDPTALIFGRRQASSTDTFRTLVNGNFCQRLGLATIPPGPVNGRMLRRTLAIELAFRPGGLLATKTHLKHISVATTEGYAARPGGAQARLLAEIAKEEQERNLLLLEQAYADHKRGIQPAGPGARELVRFFATVDNHSGSDVGAPAVRSEQAVRNLLIKRSETLHIGTANYCWFADPAKALCLRLAGTSGSDKPLINMCDSIRCPQATHHQVHRQIWDDKAKVLRTFIGGIGKRQAAERDRLTRELARAERVLDEIDAANGGEGAPRGSPKNSAARPSIASAPPWSACSAATCPPADAVTSVPSPPKPGSVATPSTPPTPTSKTSSRPGANGCATTAPSPIPATSESPGSPRRSPACAEGSTNAMPPSAT